MKSFAIRLVSGPVVMALLAGLGAACGYGVGFIAACVIVPIAAIVIGVGVAKVSDGWTAGFAVVLGILPGLGSAHAYNNIRELHTGELVRGVALADVPALRGKDRMTIRDAVARLDLQESRTRVSTWGSASTRQQITTTCSAYPLVPDGWTPADPVRVWRYTDDDHSGHAALTDEVFHPAAPGDLCRSAIDRVIERHGVRTADDAIYLEDMVSESADVRTNTLTGPFAVALVGGLWIVVVLYLGVREWFDDRRWRRNREKDSA